MCCILLTKKIFHYKSILFLSKKILENNMASVISLTILGFALITTLFAHSVKDYLASGLAYEEFFG